LADINATSDCSILKERNKVGFHNAHNDTSLMLREF